MEKRRESRMHRCVRLLTKIALLMKVTFELILLTCLQAAATGYSQETRLTLDLKQVTICKVLQTIESRTDYHFVYSSNLFPSGKVIDVRVKEMPVPDILNLVLEKTGFTFKRIEDLIVITTSNTGNIEREIRGRVVASASGEPLVGVTITVDKTGTATATDAKGEFVIKVPDNGVLVISYVGFIVQRVPVGNRVTLDIILKESTKDLNEVVVVGYGSRRKRDIISAVSEIGPEDIQKSTAVSPELAMKGQMAGVSVTSGGGDPSARPIIRIRGVSTFNFADPLYVIDGVPIAEGGAGATVDAVNDPTRRTPINIYTIVNPNDIASITVLKDAAAAAVYGVRAGNGVILITTKSGKKGTVRIDVDALYGGQKVPKTFKVLNTQEYANLYNTAYNANPTLGSGGTPLPIGQSPIFGPWFDKTSPQYLGNGPTYDWQHSIINNDSKIQNYNVRVSGGNDNTVYNFSTGYSSNDGPFIGVNTQRYSLSTNVSSKVGKYIETGINLRLVKENLVSGANGGGDLSNFEAAPWQPIYDKSNPYGYASLYSLSGPITPSSFPFNYLYGPLYTMYQNYLGLLATSSNTFNNQTILGSGYIQVQILPGLKLKGSLSGQQYAINNNNYTSFDNWQYGQTPGNPFTGVPNATAGTTPNPLSVSTGTTTNFIKAVNLDYQHSLGKHNINFTADASYQDWTWYTTSVRQFVYTNDPSLRYFNASGTEQGSYLENQHRDYIGYLGRLSYNYDNKYYIEGVVRRDGSSAFAPGQQFGTFPSVSAGWRISKESFLQNVVFINDLKIRGSYGTLGNDQTTGGWQYISVANVNPPSYNLGPGGQSNIIGTAFGNFANTSLTWEKLKSGNIGFDALFLNGFSFTMDYYHKVTNGIIQNVGLTPSSGIQDPANLNIANVLNDGFEFQAGYNKNIGQIGISVSANLTTVHNEVLALANHTALRDGDNAQDNPNLEEGLPVGFIYGYKVGGIFQNAGQIAKYNQGTKDGISTQQAPGDIWFQNLYGQPMPGSTKHNPVKDTLVDANDQTYLGSTIPKFYYGFSASANYKGFDLSIFFLGVGDVQKYNNTRAVAEAMNSGRNQWVTVLDAWTPQNTNTSMPRAVFQDPNFNNRTSNRFVENAAYLRLQNLQLGYNFPKKWLDATKAFQSLRFFIEGINLFTITKYSGLDPENDTNPPTRQFLAGLRASF